LRKILNGTTTGSLLVSEMLHDIVCYIVGFLFLAIMPIPIERTEEEKKKKATARVAVYDMHYFQSFKVIISNYI